MRSRTRSRAVTLVAIATAVVACAGPAERFERTARDLGWTRRTVSSGRFELALWDNGRLGAALHVYLAGDGSPRRAFGQSPPDPTPTDPVSVSLMALDRSPSVLLGRPCHHGVASPDCNPWYWTLGRYSDAVVASVAAAIEALAGERRPQSLVLIGYSGGGALAMLVAERVPVDIVVTIAGNLDVDSWTRHHGHTPLEGSLDPSRREPLPPAVRQLHLVAGRDREVPPSLSDRAIARQPYARRLVYPDFDHRCCWEAIWPETLERFSR